MDSSETSIGSVSDSWRVRAATWTALVAVLLIYPGVRMAVSYLDLFGGAEGREAWWALWGVIFVGHWICAAIVLAAITAEGGGRASVGLDPSLFARRRWLFIGLLLGVMAVAYLAPGHLYGDEIPERMRSHPLGPVTAAQRIFWIAMALSAGFVEELVYRGYAITRVRRIFGLPLAVLVPLGSFALMHGPSAFEPALLALYLISGAVFTTAFLFLGSSRLELLMVAHAAIDLLLVAAP